MELEQALEKIKELESKNVDLKNENADRRIKSKELETKVSNLTKQVETLENEKTELSSKHGDSTELIKSKDYKIKELSTKLKELEDITNSYKEIELKEIEDLRSKIPENIRENFINVNDKKALSQVVELYKDRTPNSPLSELDSIINKSKIHPNALTTDELQSWYSKDPAGYNEFVQNKMRLNRV